MRFVPPRTTTYRCATLPSASVINRHTVMANTEADRILLQIAGTTLHSLHSYVLRVPASLLAAPRKSRHDLIRHFLGFRIPSLISHLSPTYLCYYSLVSCPETTRIVTSQSHTPSPDPTLGHRWECDCQADTGASIRTMAYSLVSCGFPLHPGADGHLPVVFIGYYRAQYPR